jgi:hypothetical protein
MADFCKVFRVNDQQVLFYLGRDYSLLQIDSGALAVCLFKAVQGMTLFNLRRQKPQLVDRLPVR